MRKFALLAFMRRCHGAGEGANYVSRVSSKLLQQYDRDGDNVTQTNASDNWPVTRNFRLR